MASLVSPVVSPRPEPVKGKERGERGERREERREKERRMVT
jgi:hypothetical protein